MKPFNQWTAADISEFVKQVDKKTWIKIGIAGAVALLLIIFVIVPAWVQRPMIRKKIQVTEGQIAATNTLFMKKPELDKNKEEFLNQIKVAKERLYQPGESSLLLGVISKLAEENKVAIIASRPKPFEGKFPAPFNDLYEAFSYDITVEGGYHELARFISKIESHPKQLRIDHFDVKSREEDPTSHIADVGLTAVSIKKAKV